MSIGLEEVGEGTVLDQQIGFGTNLQPGNLASLAGGGYVVTWRGITNVQTFQVFAADGTPVSDAVEIGDVPSGTVTALPNGGFVFASADSGESPNKRGDAFIQIFDAFGVAETDRIDLDDAEDASEGSPRVAGLSDGGIMVGWPTDEGEGSTLGQVYNADGTPRGDTFTLIDERATPELITLENGDVILFWADETGLDGDAGGIFGQRLEDDGTPIGDPFQINDDGIGDQRNVEVVALAGGGYVVSWIGPDPDATTEATFAQVFDADDAPVSAEFILSNHSSADIAALADGGFIVGTKNQGFIRLNRYDANGEQIGEQETVDAGNTSALKGPDVAALEDGGFVVTFREDFNDGEGTSGRETVVQTFDGKLFGTSGRDAIRDEVGADDIFGQDGDDRLLGLDGRDFIDGGEGNDTIAGGEGQDELIGGDGADEIFGNKGKDVLTGDRGSDTLQGGNGQDELFGGNGGDVLSGGQGSDTLNGEGGDDELFGGNGDDALDGGTGDDALTGGRGDDTLTGGDGADQFIFNGRADSDVITDFELGVDTLVIDQSLTLPAVTEPDDILDVHGIVVEGNVVLTLRGNTTIELEGIATLESLEGDLSFL